jgi:DNA-binding NarL/FixJ family response regulator
MKKILLADDHRISRDGLRSLFQQEGYEIIGEAGNGLAAVELCVHHGPDLVIMDITMPVLNGIEALRKIRAACPDTKVIMLSMHDDLQFIVESLKAGASGYLLKESAFEELSMAVRTLERNGIYLSASIADTVIRDYLMKNQSSDAEAFSILTPREREVLQMIAEGKTTKEAAQYLRISVKTVETHRQQIMDKLGLHSIAQLTKYAIKEGITGL